MKLTILLISCLILKVSGHARLLEPPSRASMWRFGYDVPANTNDNGVNCGGLYHQSQLGGKCGICGDAFDAAVKDHEMPGGKFANGIIVEEYAEGSVMDIVIEVTASHKGHFEFKLCPNNNLEQDPTQDCFDEIPLKIFPGGEDNYVVPDYAARTYEFQVQLPGDINCDQCIVQWSYVAGNSWGTDPDGTSCTGCGQQETFRSCADIKIQPNSNPPAPTPSTTGKPSGNCQGIAPYDSVPGIGAWCDEKCAKETCPEHCLCHS